MLAASSSIFAAGAAMLASRATIKTLLRPDMLATLCIEFMHFTVALDASLFVETLLLLLIVDFLLYIYDSSRPCLEAPTSDTDTVVAIAEAKQCPAILGFDHVADQAILETWERLKRINFPGRCSKPICSPG